MTPGNLRVMQGAASRKMHSILKIRLYRVTVFHSAGLKVFYMKKRLRDKTTGRKQQLFDCLREEERKNANV